MSYKIFNEDCISSNKLEESSIDLMICDPPFGINEATFDKHYKRNSDNVIEGYVEAPRNYAEFSNRWISKANRLMKPNSSMYIISGWSNLGSIINAVENEKKLKVVNHIIWKYNFGVYTKSKFVTSHYHILYVVKGKPIFNRFCRFGPDEKDEQGGSLNYLDMEDVWCIKKEYHQGKIKNKNKLPDALIEKMLLYSSNTESIVCDFFLGNFTTALVSAKLGRTPVGFEINKNSYDYNIKLLEDMEFGSGLEDLKKVEVNLPKNQGKKISPEERQFIYEDFKIKIAEGLTKKDTMLFLSEKYGRGKFSIINILDTFKK